MIILHGVENTTSAILQLISQSNSEIKICGNYIMQAIEYEIFEKALCDARDRGIRLKAIIDIAKENVDCCKKLMKLAEIRYLDDLKANFILDETKCVSIATDTTTALQERKNFPQIAYIDVTQIVEQYHQIFDTLWNKSTRLSAQERIKEINRGQIKPFAIDIIQDRIRIERLFLSEIQRAKSEVLVVISSIRQLEYLASNGLVDIIKQAKRRGVNVMVLHSDEQSSKISDN